jgi:hypothetical protein
MRKTWSFYTVYFEKTKDSAGGIRTSRPVKYRSIQQLLAVRNRIDDMPSTFAKCWGKFLTPRKQFREL